MKHVLIIVFAGLLAVKAAAQEAVAASEPVAEPTDSVATEPEEPPANAELAAQEEAPMLEPLNAVDVSLSDFQWIKRPVVVFADTPADPRFQEQMELLLARPGELLERDVVLIVDTDPKAGSEIRRKLRPRGFMLTLIGKDGGVKLRKPFPWDVREISRSIDKMPMRQQEIRDRALQR
ncbi:MAG: DUF4174 domain-containing protein [Rhodobacter sp.]|nr:DUF4174 domain-containing protein [Rhodobacter sp.]